MARWDASTSAALGKTAGLVVAVGGCLGVGVVAGAVTANDVQTWYPALSKPAFTPPSWVFAPVWTILYVLMGVALWLLWRSVPPGGTRTWLLTLFAVQLGLNAFWSVIFFTLRSPALAFIEICFLWLTVAWLIGAAWSTHRRAALLLLPYLGWVTFAMGLNGAIVRLN